MICDVSVKCVTHLQKSFFSGLEVKRHGLQSVRLRRRPADILVRLELDPYNGSDKPITRKKASLAGAASDPRAAKHPMEAFPGDRRAILPMHGSSKEMREGPLPPSRSSSAWSEV